MYLRCVCVNMPSGIAGSGGYKCLWNSVYFSLIKTLFLQALWMAVDGSPLISLRLYQSQKNRRFFKWFIQKYSVEDSSKSHCITSPSFTDYFAWCICILIGSDNRSCYKKVVCSTWPTQNWFPLGKTDPVSGKTSQSSIKEAKYVSTTVLPWWYSLMLLKWNEVLIPGTKMKWNKVFISYTNFAFYASHSCERETFRDLNIMAFFFCSTSLKLSHTKESLS